MLAFSNDYYELIFRATQSVELFCAYDLSAYISTKCGKNRSTVYYVGVRKDGAVLGINDPDGVMLQIVNFLIQDV